MEIHLIYANYKQIRLIYGNLIEIQLINSIFKFNKACY